MLALLEKKQFGKKEKRLKRRKKKCKYGTTCKQKKHFQVALWLDDAGQSLIFFSSPVVWKDIHLH